MFGLEFKRKIDSVLALWRLSRQVIRQPAGACELLRILSFASLVFPHGISFLVLKFLLAVRDCVPGLVDW